VKGFLFNLSFKVMRFFAEDKAQIDSAVTYYKNKIACKIRQTHLNLSVRPRTETYEWLTEKSQREIYLVGKRIRGASYSKGMRHTDHLEAIEYHNS